MGRSADVRSQSRERDMQLRIILRFAPVVAALLGLGGPLAAAEPSSVTKHPLTSIDEVIDAAAVCMAATDSEYVNLDTLSKSGWKIEQVFGDPTDMAINNYNRPGSNADIMIVRLARNPGSLQCSAIGRFPNESSFAELDQRFKLLLGRAPDDTSSTTKDGKQTATSTWRLQHKSVKLAHSYGLSSVMITMRYVR